ncbi:acyl carrier protein, partial [Planotetraspora kaengkrachanensis]
LPGTSGQPDAVLRGGSGQSDADLRGGSGQHATGAARSRGATEGGVHAFRAELRDVPGVSRFEVFLASVHALLFAYGNPEPVCAVDMSTRTPEVRDHIGLFVNELPVWSAPVPGMTVAGLAGRLHDDLRLMYRFRQVPLARAVRGLRPRTALAPVSVSYRRRRDAPEFAGLDTTVDWTVFNHAVRSTLHLQAVDGPGGLDVIMQYSSRTLPDVTHLAKDLTSVMKNPDIVIEDITAGRTGHAGLAEEIRAIWREVLGIEEIGDEEDLFDLGGHSLTITQIIARMRKRLDIEVPLDVFFDTPTIAGVLESIAAAGTGPGVPDASGSRR